MEIQQLKDICGRVYTNIQSLTQADTEVLQNILKLKSIRYGRVCTYSEEDSRNVILLALKQNCVILLKFLLESKIELSEDLLEGAVDLIIEDNSYESSQCVFSVSCKDPQAILECERIGRQIGNTVIDILYISKYKNEKLKKYVAEKTLPDDVSINLVPIVDTEYKSYEMSLLHKLVVGPVLLSVIRAHYKRFRKIVKSYIINFLKRSFTNEDALIIYQIFYLINEEEHLDLLRSRRLEHNPEYVGFVYSLIRSEESAKEAYEKIRPLFEDLDSAIMVILNYSGVEEKKLQPSDEKMFVHILECLVRLLKYKSVSFYRFIQPSHRLLQFGLGPKIKGLLYELLLFYSNDPDVYIERVINCTKELDEELKSGNYFMLRRLVRFLNAYRKREDIEKGGDGLEFDVKELECRIAGLRSEDPETLIECLEVPLPVDLIKLNSVHIRAAMLKNEDVIARVMEYQIVNKTIIDDVSIINLITATPNKDFFTFASLFSDFSFFLNENVLEQISINCEGGIRWLIGAYRREFGEFVSRYSSYFNDLLKRRKEIQHSLAMLYEKMVSEHLGTLSVSMRRIQRPSFAVLLAGKEEVKEGGRFILFDDKECLSESFFRIFAMQLLYTKLVIQGDTSMYLFKKKYAHPSYPLYVKAKYIIGEDVVSDVEFLRKNLIDVSDLERYLTVCGHKGVVTENASIVPFMASVFSTASEFEKFLMLLSLKSLTKEAEAIIKNELISSLNTKNRAYLKMLALQLFKCRDKDSILRILEKNFEDKDLLLKLNVYNIASGGRYCSKALVSQGDSLIAKKALLLIYHLKIWDAEYVSELVNRLDEDGSDEWKSLVSEIKSGRY